MIQSLSFNHRLVKYKNKGFNILYPGYVFETRILAIEANVSEFQIKQLDIQIVGQYPASDYDEGCPNKTLLINNRWECIQLCKGSKFVNFRTLPDNHFINFRSDLWDADFDSQFTGNAKRVKAYFKEDYLEFVVGEKS